MSIYKQFVNKLVPIKEKKVGLKNAIQGSVVTLKTQKNQRYKKGEFRARLDTFFILCGTFILSTLLTYRYSNFVIWLIASVIIAFLLTKIYGMGVKYGKKWGDIEELSGK